MGYFYQLKGYNRVVNYEINIFIKSSYALQIFDNTI